MSSQQNPDRADASVVPVVDQQRLAADVVRPGGLIGRVETILETGSTNADLARRARTGEPVGRLLVADHQTAGRGRRDRGWSAAPGTSQAISLLWWPTREDHWQWLPLITGVAVCDAVRVVGVPAGLKWPNDVLVPSPETPTGMGRKLAGLLAERVDTAHGAACVIGIGLNTTATPEQLPVPTATSLAAHAQTPLDVTAVITDLVGRLERLLLWWQSGDQDDLLADLYANRCTTVGRSVRVDLGERMLDGEAVRIDREGALVVRSGENEHPVVAGDVVHLR